MSKTLVVASPVKQSGKTTLAFNIIIHLLNQGYKVAGTDLCGPLGDLSKLVAKRQFNFPHLKSPDMYNLQQRSEIEASKQELQMILESLQQAYDYIVIDAPEQQSYLFDEAHKYADILICPLNITKEDLQTLVLSDESQKPLSAAQYANFVWEIKKYLASLSKPYLEWLICPYKVSLINSKETTDALNLLQKTSKLYGFTTTNIIKNRNIFENLQKLGLSVTEADQKNLQTQMQMAHIFAKREFDKLLNMIEKL